MLGLKLSHISTWGLFIFSVPVWPFMMFFLYGYFGQEFICVYQLYTPLFCIWDLIGTCFLFSMASGESMEIRQSNSSGIRPPNPSLFSRQTPLPGTTRIETREDEMRYWNITPEELARYRASSPIGGNNDLWSVERFDVIWSRRSFWNTFVAQEKNNVWNYWWPKILKPCLNFVWWWYVKHAHFFYQYFLIFFIPMCWLYG